MNHAEILSKINSLAREIFDDESLTLEPNTISDDVDDWDSANHIRLMLAIMDEFKVDFKGSEITAPDNVGELVDLVASKLKT